jgi:hypothetical protein
MVEEEKYPETPEELMVRASVQVFLADKNHPKPEAFGSGCMLEHRDRLFVVSVGHVTYDEELKAFLETNIPAEENGERGMLLKPVGGFCYFEAFKIKDATNIKQFEELLQNGQPLDVTFAEVKGEITLRQPAIDFGAFKIGEGHKVIIDSRDIAEPDKLQSYGFFGRIKPAYQGTTLQMENTLKRDLKFHRTHKHFHLFLAKEIITDANDYKGCSGGPIIDSDGKLVALVSKVGVPSKLVYGFSIQECIKLLNIAIDTGLI